MKKVIKRIMYRNRYSSEAYISYLRKKGAYIGEHTRFINPVNTYIDDQCISYISIGRKCCIAAGVTILAHDWSVCVVAEKFGQMLPGQKRTIIGNNVFVGMHTIILSGANIGDNVVIGAGAVCSGTIESDSVYAGNPARKIMTIEEYYEKCKKRYVPGAKEYVSNFEKRYGRLPEISEMGVYRTMFIDKNSVSEEMFSDSIYKNAYMGVPKMYDSIKDLMEHQN